MCAHVYVFAPLSSHMLSLALCSQDFEEMVNVSNLWIVFETHFISPDIPTSLPYPFQQHFNPPPPASRSLTSELYQITRLLISGRSNGVWRKGLVQTHSSRQTNHVKSLLPRLAAHSKGSRCPAREEDAPIFPGRG